MLRAHELNVGLSLEGNLWGQQWGAILNRVKPYPNARDAEFRKMMLQKGYKPHKFAELADEFFRSIGLYTMTPKFWNASIFERPADGRSMDCHASAFNMIVDDDFRFALHCSWKERFSISDTRIHSPSSNQN